MFCPKCGSVLILKKEDSKKVLACSCGYKDKEGTKNKLVEKFNDNDKVEVVSEENESLPLVDIECPKCSHGKAYFWTVQTRASDEPETKFHKCEKCKHTWRDYS